MVAIHTQRVFDGNHRGRGRCVNAALVRRKWAGQHVLDSKLLVGPALVGRRAVHGPAHIRRGMRVIPKLNTSGVLPPFIGEDATEPAGTSPYHCSMSQLCERFGSTPERRAILEGLLRFRSEMRAAGITSGWQFIAGSFVEDCEVLRGRPPDDVDVVTFAVLPATTPEEKRDLIAAHPTLFSPRRAKAEFKCDAYMVDLDVAAPLLVGA
jgi:hypothetical protein